ncbi:deaminase domain-containing protein [Clostridium septicum]|uniref:deaminase domain-containing protein n=1 Tax=Clostridium septicum TaxID=1504 RepID=UPI004041EA5C
MATRLNGISFKPENQQFKTLNINKDNVVDGINSWNRNVDTEFKIIEDTSGKLGDNVNAKGNITLYTDLYPCPSCQYVIEQFMKKYSNIKVDIIYELD